jgi:hypothetical protein
LVVLADATREMMQVPFVVPPLCSCAPTPLEEGAR